MTEELQQQLSAGVLKLVMNRPERRNAMTPTMLSSLLQALRDAAHDTRIRAVVLTGEGGAFCAGGDVKAMAEGNGEFLSLEQRVAELRRVAECSRLLHEMRKPTVAIARGATAGAGLSLALACDLFIAADTAKITSAFVSVALSGDFGGHWFLTHRIGARARAFVLLSPIIDGNEALALGLVDRVFSDPTVDASGWAIAQRLAAGPTIAMGYMKENLNFVASGATLTESIDFEAIRHIRSGMTQEHKEATRAFVEKRSPNFVDF